VNFLNSLASILKPYYLLSTKVWFIVRNIGFIKAFNDEQKVFSTIVLTIVDLIMLGFDIGRTN